MSLKNYKIEISYDGTDLLGWQIRKTGRTVQGDIETALRKIFNQNITLIGSGRTDSGVHALRQVANFKVESDMNPDTLIDALNGNLKRDIYIAKCDIVDDDFHSRFSAIKREYNYRIEAVYRPIYRNYVWSLDCTSLDIDTLHECSKLILGEHDFTQLSKKNDEIDNKICNVFYSDWAIDDFTFTYRIRANRFLHHMVRYLVGVMIEVSKNHLMTLSDFKSMIDAEERKMIFKAPSKGLYLDTIYYE